MKREIGVVKALYRYPVKSMAGERLASALLGWHGIEGDRRFAFIREGQTGGFPWLTATKLESLITYQPYTMADDAASPTHVRTPAGEELDLGGEALRRELSAAYGAEVRLMQLNQGMFDEAPLSLISTATVEAIGESAGRALDVRRFRPNILVETARDAPFPEDEWVGKLVAFGERVPVPAMSVTTRDVRCAMVNLDPETARPAPEVLKAAVRANQTCAGVYGSTFRSGTVSVGDRVYLIEV